MDHGDLLVRQVLARVQGGQLGVVPLADLAQEHLGQHRTGHAQFTLFEALQIDDRHRAANNGWKLHHAVLVQVFTLDWRIGRTESHRLGADLADTAGRADRLVVQARAGFLLVSLGPLGVDREREGGARAGDVGSNGGAHGHGGQGGGGNGLEQSALGVHRLSSWLGKNWLTGWTLDALCDIFVTRHICHKGPG